MEKATVFKIPEKDNRILSRINKAITLPDYETDDKPNSKKQS